MEHKIQVTGKTRNGTKTNTLTVANLGKQDALVHMPRVEIVGAKVDLTLKLDSNGRLIGIHLERTFLS